MKCYVNNFQHDLNVTQDLQMLKRHFVNGCHHYERCDHHTTKHNPMSRLIKPTLVKKVNGNIKKHLDRLTPDQQKFALKTIHSNEVKQCVTKHHSKPLLIFEQTPAERKN